MRTIHRSFQATQWHHPVGGASAAWEFAHRRPKAAWLQKRLQRTQFLPSVVPRPNARPIKARCSSKAQQQLSTQTSSGGGDGQHEQIFVADTGRSSSGDPQAPIIVEQQQGSLAAGLPSTPQVQAVSPFQPAVTTSRASETNEVDTGSGASSSNRAAGDGDGDKAIVTEEEFQQQLVSTTQQRQQQQAGVGQSAEKQWTQTSSSQGEATTQVGNVSAAGQKAIQAAQASSSSSYDAEELSIMDEQAGHTARTAPMSQLRARVRQAQQAQHKSSSLRKQATLESKEQSKEQGKEHSTSPAGAPVHQARQPRAVKQVAPGDDGVSVAQVAAIAIPSLGSVLADPLMSLVDTGCVGRVSTAQLAALNPNTALYNLIFQGCLPSMAAMLPAVALRTLR